MGIPIFEKIFGISRVILITSCIIGFMCLMNNLDILGDVFKDPAYVSGKDSYVGTIVQAVRDILKAVDVADFFTVILSGITTLFSYFLK